MTAILMRWVASMKKSLKILTICTLATSPALAQTAPAPTGGTTKSAPAKPTNNNQAMSIAQRMQSNGGSLLRATMEAAPEPGQATLKDVSFTFVPDPEPRVLKKHDLVTVIIREESAFKTKGTTDLKRQSDLDAKLDEYIQLSLSNLRLKNGVQGSSPLEVKAEASRKFKGEGNVDRSDSLTARIEAEVLDVKPNGTLVLQATKRIKTDDEEQQFILTGICRAIDVSADNSILSSSLHDFTLEKKHSGAVRDTTKRGLVGKFLDFVNPF